MAAAIRVLFENISITRTTLGKRDPGMKKPFAYEAYVPPFKSYFSTIKTFPDALFYIKWKASCNEKYETREDAMCEYTFHSFSLHLIFSVGGWIYVKWTAFSFAWFLCEMCLFVFVCLCMSSGPFGGILMQMLLFLFFFFFGSWGRCRERRIFSWYRPIFGNEKMT